MQLQVPLRRPHLFLQGLQNHFVLLVFVLQLLSQLRCRLNTEQNLFFLVSVFKFGNKDAS